MTAEEWIEQLEAEYAALRERLAEALEQLGQALVESCSSTGRNDAFMIRHLIVFNTPAEVSCEQCLAMAGLARQELSQIPGVLNVSFGVAIAENARYRYHFTIDLRDERALRTYQDHPMHVAFANNHFRPLAPERITTDYELFS